MGRSVFGTVVAVVSLAGLAGPLLWGAEQREPWQEQVLAQLCEKYLGAAPSAQEDQAARLERLSRMIGERLATGGAAATPAEDVAALALLLARGGSPAQAPSTAPEPLPPSAEAAKPKVGGEEYSDIGKGQEGFIQAVERLAELPISERMVMTGDITAGFQAATVSANPDLTSMFGRARLNFVARAVPASPDGRFSEGYFFVQMLAAGGPFDASVVGGRASFSPFNDVATDRSAFNEGLSRGNVYLSKVYYQQRLNLAKDYVVGRVGVIDFSDFFDVNEFANNEARQFINSALVNSTAFKTGIVAPGFMAEYHRQTRWDWLREAVVRGGYAVSRTERAFTSPLWTGELQLRTLLQGRDATVRIGGSAGNVADVGGISGFYFNFDHWVSRDIGVFARYGISNAGPGSQALGPAHQSYSGGVQWRFADREDRISAWGFGFSQTFGIETENSSASERVLETYYRWQMARNFSLTPDFQLVLGSGGANKGGTHTVLGIRMNFGF